MSKSLKLPTLLVIAENPKIRFWIKKHLDDRFFLIYAEKKSEAMEALYSRLDFIIIDSELESCDALLLCQQMSQITKKNLIPIFMITGRLKKSFRTQAQEYGVTDFLSNQLDPVELDEKIQAGEKNVAVREKTADLSASIQIPKQAFSHSSLKDKFVLNDQGLKLLAEAKQENSPVALLLLRIDHFESLNNKEVEFNQLAKFLRGLLREKDLLIPSTEGRLILLLPNTPLSSAKQIAERLQERMKVHPFSISIAVSAMEPSEKGFSQMIDSAIKSFKTRSETNLIISIDPEDSL
jgi:PleD family two-component response regulator